MTEQCVTRADDWQRIATELFNYIWYDTYNIDKM